MKRKIHTALFRWFPVEILGGGDIWVRELAHRVEVLENGRVIVCTQTGCICTNVNKFRWLVA